MGIKKVLTTMVFAGSVIITPCFAVNAAAVAADEPAMLTMELHPEMIELQRITRNASDGKPLVVIDYASFNLGGCGLSTANIERVKDINAIYQQYAYKRLDEYLDMANESLKDQALASSLPFTLKMKPSIVMADSKGLSILSRYDVNVGGPHPNYWFSGMNFDASGKALKITDICTDIHKLCEVLKKEIKKSGYAKHCFNIDESFINYDNQNGRDLTFVRTDEAVYFYFSPYSIAPFAAGSTVVKLDYAKYRKLLKNI